MGELYFHSIAPTSESRWSLLIHKISNIKTPSNIDNTAHKEDQYSESIALNVNTYYEFPIYMKCLSWINYNELITMIIAVNGLHSD